MVQASQRELTAFWAIGKLARLGYNAKVPLLNSPRCGFLCCMQGSAYSRAQRWLCGRGSASEMSMNGYN